MQQLHGCTQSTHKVGCQRGAPRPIVRCNVAAAPGTASKTVSDLQKDIISLAGSKYGHDLDASTRAEASRSAGVVLVHATRDQHAHACNTFQKYTFGQSGGAAGPYCLSMHSSDATGDSGTTTPAQRTCKRYGCEQQQKPTP